jgi:PhnB protein
MTIPWKPANRPTLIPAMPGGKKLIEFVTNVLGGKVAALYEAPGGGVAHAELSLGESLLMTGDPMGPQVIPPGSASVYVPDVNATYTQALAAGAKSLEEPKDQFYGDRTARIIDPCGNQWAIATHKEDVSEDELHRRMAAMTKG